ncbi:hypothetical protein [Nonomuraea zeae]|uniref:Uncharacterized protein n=1 Tax=Nonomuraea zeae TaxID=1642303 RepID=A0A5S4FKP8_9ACTN|nr:hypothetical protein [Nonomuraea zeae]TMR21306.1 hypothetical protein ETD85_51115 [Nonomuraea zeae]
MNTNETNTHQWQAATTFKVRVAAEQIQDMIVAGALGETPVVQTGPIWSDDVIAVNCRRCMRLFADAADEPCIPVPMP